MKTGPIVRCATEVRFAWNATATPTTSARTTASFKDLPSVGKA
jgi:hypothetical protein